jgi:hypothetical protein
MTEQEPIPIAAETQVEPDPSSSAGLGTQLDPDLPVIALDQPAEIPPEEAAPMIDIHPPAHGAITRRDFFVHLFIVVLGILIAIGLEQAVEYLHHRELAAEARRTLAEECKQKEGANDFNIFATQRHERDLQHALAVLDALRARRPVPPGPFILKRVSSFYADEDWQNSRQTGTINYLGGNIAGGLRFRHTVEDNFTKLSDRSYDDLAQAASVLRTANDPLNRSLEENMAFSDFFRRLEDAHENLPQQEIDYAWATKAESGNLAALSPAQIDSLERAIQIALADDDAMLTTCFTIKRNLVRNPGY